MRVLIATTAGSGHIGPLVPFGRALEQAGHDVVVTAPASFAAAVERAGFVHRPFPDASPEELGAVFAGLAELSNDQANAVVVGQVFGRIDTGAALPGVEALVASWRPDLIVRESCEFASYIVAEAAGVPHVHVAVGLASFGAAFRAVLDEPLTRLGAEPGLGNLLAAPTLSFTPGSFEDPGTPGDAGIRRYRDGADAPTLVLPDWWPGSTDPLLYVTFGSVAAGMGLFPDLYRAVVAALADQPVRVLLTVGDAGDPAELAPTAANIHVERWWPQAAVMPHAAAMVGHGGFGTTMGGLAAGVPMVVVPLFADQPHNARRVEAIGAGIVLEGGAAAVGELAGAVRRVLEEGSYRAAALRIAEEIAELPVASASVPLLESLAGSRRVPTASG